MQTVRGRNVRLEFALTFAAAKTITGLTRAMPGVATSNAHGLADGTVGYWSVPTGMVELDQQVTRVKDGDTNTFELQSLDTTDYSVWDGGTFTPVATWGLLAEHAGYAIGGGAGSDLDDSRMHDKKSRSVAGMLGAQNITIDVRSQTINSAVMEMIENSARRQLFVVGRLTMHDGAVRVFGGTPSMPGESASVNQLGTGQFAIAVPGWVLKGAA